jgi:nitronate monooxygenase
VFQFGTRLLLTQESPISDEWKRRLITLGKGDILLHRFSPTGFYSSAVNNSYIQELEERSARQINYSREAQGEQTVAFSFGPRKRDVYISPADEARAKEWQAAGFGQMLRTPDQSLIFVTAEKAAEIRQDQTDCMGCLSQCRFSNWMVNEPGNTGKKADPRSFCIQKTLQDVAHQGSVEHNLVFAGHNAFHFAEDPFFSNGFIPTVRQMFDRIVTGD